MNKFINSGAILKNTPSYLYRCPTDSNAVVHTLFFTTTNLNESASVTIEVFDASQGTSYKLGYNLEILPKTTLSFDKPINLDSNDILQAYSDKIDEVHAFASVMLIIPASL